MQVKCNKLIEM